MRSTRRTFAYLLQVGAIVLVQLALAGCTRTVTWEEEVPLNTGETIWIQRSMPWELLGGFGNPFDIAMRPTREQTIRFTYRGKKYVYVGRADVAWIAISPMSGSPVLIAPAASYGWDGQNHFLCAVPHYVQLVPDATGKTWNWPPRIEPWLFDLPANVMASIPSLKEDRKHRYTRSDRDERDANYRRRFPTIGRIDPLYKQDGCLMKFGS